MMAASSLVSIPCSCSSTKMPARLAPAKFTPAHSPPACIHKPTKESHRGSVMAFAALQAEASEAATIPEEELIQMTKDFVAAGFGAADDPDVYDDDMIFRGPVVGPLPKDQYIAAVTGFKVGQAFPDIEVKSFGFSVDPQDPYRVWYFTQTTGTHSGDFSFAGNTIPPTGGKIQNGTEASSVIWTPDRKIKYISVGYCVDRINSNTPNGTMKVAVVGLLRATGKGEIWDFISNPAVQWVTKAVNKLRGKPSTDVPFEDLPEWWKKIPDANLRGAENYYK